MATRIHIQNTIDCDRIYDKILPFFYISPWHDVFGLKYCHLMKNFRQVPSEIFLTEALEVKNEFALGLWQKENGPLPAMGEHHPSLFPVETIGEEQSIDRPVEISDLNLSLDELISIDSRQLKALGNVTIA